MSPVPTPPATPLAVIVLAAGQGTRMKSSLHKVLHPIAGRPMLLHLLGSVGDLAPARQVVVVGAGREQVEKAVAGKGVDIAVQAEQLGTGHAVARAKDALAGFEGDVLILYGDVPLVRAETMRAMVERLHAANRPACVVLGFRPDDAAAYQALKRSLAVAAAGDWNFYTGGKAGFVAEIVRKASDARAALFLSEAPSSR